MTNLGRGLDALISTSPDPVDKSAGIATINVNQVVPNRFQPRKVFDQEKLKELSESLIKNGIIQPIIVTRRDEGQYELVAGERRLQAAKMAGIDKVPVIIRSLSESEQLQLALIENIQREDLNAIEEALAYNQLCEQFNYTHTKIAEIVGKDRVTITNYIRLLKLSEKIQKMLLENKLTPGHARAILQVAQHLQDDFADSIVVNNLSVRKTELKAKKIKKTGAVDIVLPLFEVEEENPNRIHEEHLSKIYNGKVTISPNSSKGKICFHYYSENELNLLLKSFDKQW